MALKTTVLESMDVFSIVNGKSKSEKENATVLEKKIDAARREAICKYVGSLTNEEMEALVRKWYDFTENPEKYKGTETIAKVRDWIIDFRNEKFRVF